MRVRGMAVRKQFHQDLAFPGLERDFAAGRALLAGAVLRGRAARGLVAGVGLAEAGAALSATKVFACFCMSATACEAMV